MAVPPVATRRDDSVLARLAQLRNELEELISAVRDGGTTLTGVFGDSNSFNIEHAFGFVYLVKLAESVPGIGKVRARRILEDHGLGERTRVCDVPAATRAALVQVLV
ncbi:MAG: hypothetical protein ACKO2Q_07920 [Actinomycetota bacterium]